MALWVLKMKIKAFFIAFLALVLLMQLFSCGGTQEKRNAELIVHYNGKEVHRSGSKYIGFPKFERIAKNKQKKYFIFSAEWCPSCKFLEKALKQMKKQGRVPIINIDEHWGSSLAANLGVNSVPTLVEADKNGNIVRIISGPSKIVMHLLLYNDN